jgi:arabinofuranan 3-O-arabinosyltransferase
VSTALAEPTVGDARSPDGGKPRAALGIALFAAVVYVPILLMQVGKVDADTKQYLYLDPGQFLKNVATLWDPSVGAGTVSHQTVGYLFPMGPFFWICETLLSLPAWVAQRLWLGSLIFLAGLGMRYMMRTLGVRGLGVPVAMLAFAFSPYVVQFASIYSGFLTFWAVLPWWVGFAVLGLRTRSWKYPALFAISVQLVAALNATAFVLIAIAPALWIPHALFVTRETTWRKVWTLVWRTGLLTLLTSLWWIVALLVEGKYGINLLRFTETLQTVATSALPIEILRGLGYWFFYGRDPVSLWNDAFPTYASSLIIATSIAIPALAMLSAGVVRWAHRLFFVVLVVVGLTISVGAAPYGHPSVFGAVFKWFTNASTSGMAFRNSARAVPLVALGFAALLGSGVNALVDYLRARDLGRLATRVAVAAGILCLVNAAGSWGGLYYSKYLERPQEIPAYYRQALGALDAQPHSTRVLALPGSDFASYRWGDARDAIEPGLMTRPFIARQLEPLGTPATINLLRALDAPLENTTPDRMSSDNAVIQPYDTNVVAPIARLLGVGDVLLRFDYATDRWNLIPATEMASVFLRRPIAGLTSPESFGTKIPGQLSLPDPGNVTVPAGTDPSPSPLAVLHVKNPLAIVRTKSTDAPMVVDGDGTGLVDLAGAGLLDARRLVLYSASSSVQTLDALPSDAVLVVTDTNRRRAEAWSRMYENFGYTEQAGEVPMTASQLDQRLEMFPGSNDDARTVTIMHGVESVQATTYGDRIFGFTPAQRPSRALDGNPNTEWVVDGASDVGHERLRIVLDKPVSTDHIDIVQPLESGLHRWITKISVRFDGGSPRHFTLNSSSRTIGGQTIHFAPRTFSTAEVEIDGVYEPAGLAGINRNPVGFAEIRIRDRAAKSDVRVNEVTRLPVDLMKTLGATSLRHPLAFVLSRDTTDDTSMNREISLPTERMFSIGGVAVVGNTAPGEDVDRVLGIPDAQHGGVTVSANHSYAAPNARPSAALDGNPATAWNTPLAKTAVGDFLSIQLANATTIDHLNLSIVRDDRHSRPTELTITTDGGDKRVISLQQRGSAGPDDTEQIPVSFPAVTARKLKVMITGERFATVNEAIMPVGIAELGIPGLASLTAPANVSHCINDLLTIDGTSMPMRVTGSSVDAIGQRPLRLAPCDKNDTVSLAAGTHQIAIRTSAFSDTGIDVSDLVLASAAGGRATSATALAAFKPPETHAAPELHIIHEGQASLTARVDNAAAPFWFVLGQSNSSGWTLTVDGKKLGPSQLADGYANGWLISPSAHGATTIRVEWTPQRALWKAMLVSLATFLLCVVVVAVALVRRRRTHVSHPAVSDVPSVRQRHSLSGGRPSSRFVWPLVVGLTIAGTLLVHPWVGALVGGFTYAACRRPRWRLLLRIVPGAALAFVGFTIALTQFIRHYTLRFDWAQRFDWARVPVWIIALLLLADAAIAVASRDDAAASP